MDCEEVAEAAAKRKRMPKHLTDGRPCWCGPRVEVRLDGDIVIHNDHDEDDCGDDYDGDDEDFDPRTTEEIYGGDFEREQEAAFVQKHLANPPERHEGLP